MPPSDESQAISKETFVSESEAGSKFHTYQIGRTVKIYPILETELRSISMLNTLVIISFSAGTGFLTYGIGLVTDGVMQESITETGHFLFNFVVPLCAIVCLLCYGVAYWAFKNRITDLEKLLEETEVRR